VLKIKPPALNKRVLQDQKMAEALGVSQIEARRITSVVCKVFREMLLVHDIAVLPGIGRMRLVDKKGRSSLVHPVTGKRIPGKDKQMIRIRLSSKF